MPYYDILVNKLQVLQTDRVRTHAAIDDFEIRSKLHSVFNVQEECIGMLAAGINLIKATTER